MKKITGPWTHRTPTVTIEYGSGEHEVTDAIAAAYDAAHPKEEADGNRDSAPGAPGRARPAKG